MNSFESYRENEIAYLISENNCLIFIQIYQDQQKNLDALRTFLNGLDPKQNTFRVQKLPAVSFTHAHSPFIINGAWIPVSNKNFVIYTEKKVNLSILNQIFKNLNNFKSSVIFCKNQELVVDYQRVQKVPSSELSMVSLQQFIIQKWFALHPLFSLLSKIPNVK